MSGVEIQKVINVPKVLNVLFQGWVNIPHSYSLVLCFQLVFLHKNYSDKISFFLEEKKYYNPEWVSKNLDYFPKEYKELLHDKNIFKEFTGKEKIDIIYSITFPYSLEITRSTINIPKCVFYTSEFMTLDSNYFSVKYPLQIKDSEKEEYLRKYISKSGIFFTSPSIWSKNGSKKFILNDERNRIIPHGVDTSIFFPDKSKRKEIRDKFSVKDTDILLVNIGSMTGNKGILLILQVLNHLVNKMNIMGYKLLLKGTADLYKSQQMLQMYLSQLGSSEEEIKKLLTCVLYLENTVPYSEIRLLYGACDVYISPYLAEGFNLTVLEAIACGLNVIVPETGSTKEYISDIYQNNGSEFIYYVKSEVIEEATGIPINYENISGKVKCVNKIDPNNLLNILLNKKDSFLFQKDSEKMISFFSKEYSCNKVSELLFSYLSDIVNK